LKKSFVYTFASVFIAKAFILFAKGSFGI
jgi:hypothetical protein